MTLRATSSLIRSRDVDDVSLALCRMGEALVGEARGRASLENGGGGVLDTHPENTRHVLVSENVRAWVVKQYCERFAIWVAWGPEPAATRLARYSTLGEWARHERLARARDRQGEGTLLWVTVEDDLISFAMVRIMTTLFTGTMAHLFSPDPENEGQMVREAARMTRAVHAIAGMLPTQRVWTSMGERGQRLAMESESARLRQASHRLLSASFAEWIGTSVEGPRASRALVHRLNRVLQEATDIEIQALSLFGLDHGVELDAGTWVQVHDLIARERGSRGIRRPRNLFGAI